MKIRQVYIEGFGKFEDFSLNLKDGLNIVFGGNAAGKTTLANFIRYCLTGNLAKLEDYRPWYSKSSVVISKPMKGQCSLVRERLILRSSSSPLFTGACG